MIRQIRIVFVSFISPLLLRSILMFRSRNGKFGHLKAQLSGCVSFIDVCVSVYAQVVRQIFLSSLLSAFIFSNGKRLFLKIVFRFQIVSLFESNAGTTSGTWNVSQMSVSTVTGASARCQHFTFPKCSFQFCCFVDLCHLRLCPMFLGEVNSICKVSTVSWGSLLLCRSLGFKFP